MSCTVTGTTIKLTRGDTMNLKVNIEHDGVEYVPDPDDQIRFALKHNLLKSDKSDFTDETPLIIKDIPSDTLILKLDPEDTKDLAFGTYAYDIEITFKDGAVDTFITNSKFKLTEEVY